MSTVAASRNCSSDRSSRSTGPVDSSAADAIKDLPKHGKVSAEQTAQMLRKATEDADGQAAGLEHTDIMEWARDNWDRLSPESKKMIELYDKVCLQSLAQGTTSIERGTYDKMMGEIDALVPKKPGAKTGDASADAAIAELKKGHGKISGEQMQAAIEKGTADLDNQSAGTEFAAFMKFQADNRSRLSPEAKQVLEIYERYAREAQGAGLTGIPLEKWNTMLAEMKTVHTYSDQTAGVELDALSKKGMVSGKDIMAAIERGTKDLDGQAAGLEFNDFAKWARDNAERLGGSAKDVMKIYEKYARKAQADGRTGLTPDEHAHMLKEMRAEIREHNHHGHHGHHVHRG